uniref:Uncharacterized protein n=1 Tax=Lepeophtheirus salmonis TaxID=72036 RepID=A0A0K2UT49_LEPSM
MESRSVHNIYSLRNRSKSCHSSSFISQGIESP